MRKLSLRDESAVFVVYLLAHAARNRGDAQSFRSALFGRRHKALDKSRHHRPDLIKHKRRRWADDRLRSRGKRNGDNGTSNESNAIVSLRG